MAGVIEVNRTCPRPEDGWSTTRSRGEGWQSAATLPGLLDVSVVRVELARMRGPRPATQLFGARAPRSTVSGER
jgi:hypothetical protein